MAKEISLRDWLAEIGVKEAGKIFKVCESTVKHWRVGRELPRSITMWEIQKYSKGRVTVEAMVRAYYEAAMAAKKTKSKKA